MKDVEKVDLFQEEINQIVEKDMKEYATEAISMLPDYFFDIPASSTGKYHPKYSLGEGGLVRHSKSAVRIAIELFRFHTLQNYTDREKDMIIIALILHDGFKSGYPKQKYTVTEHPLLAGRLVRNSDKLVDIIGVADSIKIAELIETHMSEWNTDYKTKKEVLPLPKNHMQKFVALCDYLASRKCLEFNFEVSVVR